MAKDRLLLGLLVIILGFNIAYAAVFGIGTGIFLAFTAIGILFIYPRQKISTLTLCTALVAIVSGLLVGYRANGFVQGFSVAVSLASIGLLLLLISAPRVPTTIWNLISSNVLYGLNSIFSPFRLLAGMNTDSQKHLEHEAWWRSPFQLLKTSIITLVIFAIFTSLLMSADPIFKVLIDSILKDALGRISWSLVLAAVFTCLLSIKLTESDDKTPQLRFLSVHDVVVPVLVLVGLFGFFLLVQGKYLFASHEVFKQFNLTYSQYVRKGFIELLVATGLAGIICYILILKQRVTERKNIQWLTIVLLIELGLLLASAWRRDLMYIEVYGLTRMRIIGEVFLFWLTGNVMLLLGLSTIMQFEEKVVLVGISVLTIGALGYFTLVNMDLRIASTSPKQQYGMRDLFYLANLSPDAASTWEGIVRESEERISALINKDYALTDDEKAQLANIKLALISLVAQRERLEKKFGPWDQVKKDYLGVQKPKPYERALTVYPLPEYQHQALERRLRENRKWQAYNWSDRQAYKLLTSKRDIIFNRVDELLTTIVRFQASRYLDLYKEEHWILYDFEYPFVNLKINYTPSYNAYIAPTPTPTPLGRLNTPVRGVTN